MGKQQQNLLWVCPAYLILYLGVSAIISVDYEPYIWEIFLIPPNCVIMMLSMKIILLLSKYISLMNSEAIFE